jgi:hypothetical protein
VSEKFVCAKCNRVLGYSFLRHIGCLLQDGHSYRRVGTFTTPGYFGVTRHWVSYACDQCGAVKSEQGY